MRPHGTWSRYNNNGCRCDLCRAAARERRRESRRANPETYRRLRRRYAGRQNDYRRAWRERNRERELAMRRAHYEADPSRNAAACRKWYLANRDRVKVNRSRRRALLAGAVVEGAQFSAERLAERMSFYGNRCWMCGGPFEHVDHVKPISKGGLHILANLRPACRSCNARKKDRWPFEPYVAA